MENKETKTILFKDKSAKRYAGIVYMGIYPNCKWKDFDIDEPVLYMQQKRKKSKSKYYVIKEVVIPLSEIVSMR